MDHRQRCQLSYPPPTQQAIQIHQAPHKLNGRNSNVISNALHIPPINVTPSCTLCIQTERQFLDRYSGLREDDKFADLTIIVGIDDNKRVFKAHKCIVCAHSGFFRAACTSPFRESTSGEIELPESAPDVMEAVFSYLYTCQYQTSFDPYFEAKVYAQADILDIKALKDLAFSNLQFGYTCLNNMRPEDFGPTMELLMMHTHSEIAEGKLDRVMQWVTGQLGDLWKCPAFVKYLEETPDLCVFLFRACSYWSVALPLNNGDMVVRNACKNTGAPPAFNNSP